MLTDDSTPGMPQPARQPPPNGSRSALWLASAAVFGAVIIALVVVILLLMNDDDTATTSTATVTTSASTTAATSSTATTAATTSSLATTATTTTSSTATSTTTAPSTTTEPSTTTTGFDQLDTAVWPDPGSRIRFDSPLLLAASYAEDYLDLDDAVVGDFQRGDSRSGEVEIRSPESNEAVTTVLARQLGPDDDWFVIGSVSAAIVLDQPETLEAIDSPVIVSGQAALAFDGNVSVELRAHDTSEPLAADSTTVASGDPGPYRFELAWSSDADWAQVVVVTRAADSGALLSAAVIPVRLG